MKERVQVAFASGSADLIPTLLEKMREIRPGSPVYVVSEFPLEGELWLPYHHSRTVRQNLAKLRWSLRDKQIDLVALILQPKMPHWWMRLTAFLLGGRRTLFFNEQLDHFMLRPASLPVIARHVLWRTSNLLRWELKQPGAAVHTFLWRLWHPWAFERPVRYWFALLAGVLVRWQKAMRGSGRVAREALPAEPGVSVVVPSRNGRELLAAMLPSLLPEMADVPGEVIVVDNGSDDGTTEFLRECFPSVRVVVYPVPLSFARACNLGIARSLFSHVLLLNNDMHVEAGFVAPLREAFQKVPDLFCATAQILFPEGQRRQETGKAVMPPKRKVTEFPVTCLEPIDGEDLTYVLYGSGGCSLFDGGKLRRLGGLLEIYEPAYVEDLDLGFRGWQQGWPSVFVANAKVVHKHRATTSRYYTEKQLARVLELNYLRFVARTVAGPAAFRRLWAVATRRLNHLAAQVEPDRAALAALRAAWRAPAWAEAGCSTVMDEESILAIGSGEAAVFPGRAPSGRPVVVVASPYLPFPLSHGGAVRMFNLMRCAAADYDQVLVAFVDELHRPPAELLELCVEIVEVHREGTHAVPMTERPEVVEEFDSPVFHAVLRQTVRKWGPEVAQLEFTQMAQYAGDCAPVKTLLVEHDITLDLYAQLLQGSADWETTEQHRRWERFERDAWPRVDAVVTMSEKDRRTVGLPSAVALPNGVDLERFQPGVEAAEARRILFIGSFAHLPNVLAIEFFLREVWPLLEADGATLHIIAGNRPRYFLERYRDRATVNVDLPGVELEAFVADPRAAYRRAAVVVAPLLASAGTNIKIMEAMAMGKAIVSTPAGINGLDDLRDGSDLLVARSGEEMAAAIRRLFEDGELRARIERQARATVERRYDWRVIGERQRAVYRKLAGQTFRPSTA